MDLLRRLEDAERKQLYIEYRISAANEAAKELTPQGIAPTPSSGTTKTLGTPGWPAGGNCNLIIYCYYHNTGEPLVATISAVDNQRWPTTFQCNGTTNAAGYCFMAYGGAFLWKNGDNCYSWGVNFGYLADYNSTCNIFTLNADATGNAHYSAELWKR